MSQFFINDVNLFAIETLHDMDDISILLRGFGTPAAKQRLHSLFSTCNKLSAISVSVMRNSGAIVVDLFEMLPHSVEDIFILVYSNSLPHSAIRALARCSFLKQVSIDTGKFTDPVMRELVLTMAAWPNLVGLDLHGPQTASVETLCEFAAALRNCKTLSSIHFYNWGPSQFDFCAFFANPPVGLIYLELGGCDLDDTIAPHLFAFFEKTPRLHQLDLAENRLGDKTMDVLAACAWTFTRNQGLRRKLFLQLAHNNQVTDKGCHAFSFMGWPRFAVVLPPGSSGRFTATNQRETPYRMLALLSAPPDSPLSELPVDLIQVVTKFL